MKYLIQYFIFSLLAILIGTTSCIAQQKSFIIDLDNKNINEVVLGNGSVNFPGCRIYLYNIWISDKDDKYLITASILPDITTGRIKWDTLNTPPLGNRYINIIDTALESIHHYITNCHKFFFTKENYYLKSDEYTAVIKKKDAFYTAPSNPCIVEFYKYSSQAPYRLEDYDYITIYPNGITYAPQDIENIRSYFYKNFKGDISFQGKLLILKKDSNQDKIIKFWITPPPSLDAGWQYYGIEQFNFISGIGVVAGTFRQYLRGGTGAVVSNKLSHFEQHTKIFTPITINGIPFAQYLQKVSKK